VYLHITITVTLGGNWGVYISIIYDNFTRQMVCPADCSHICLDIVISRIWHSSIVTICMFYRSLFVLWTFSFGHCFVCSSSIYGFWLPLWYLQTLLMISHLGQRKWSSQTGDLIKEVQLYEILYDKKSKRCGLAVYEVHKISYNVPIQLLCILR
jgi:hypothetical protein